jgi:hypothetical protein
MTTRTTALTPGLTGTRGTSVAENHGISVNVILTWPS